MRQPSLLLRPVINITTFYTLGCRQVGNFNGDESWNMTGSEELHQQGKRIRLGVVICTYRDSSNEIVVKLGVDEVPSCDGHSLGTRVTLRVFLHEFVLDSKQIWGPLTRVFDDAYVNCVLKENANEVFRDKNVVPTNRLFPASPATLCNKLSELELSRIRFSSLQKLLFSIGGQFVNVAVMVA